MKAFLLAYNPMFPSDFVHKVLNETRAVAYWASPFNGAVIVLSQLTVAELAAVLREHFNGVWFIVTEADKNNANGLLPAPFWEYVNDPFAAWAKQTFSRLAAISPPPPPAVSQRGLFQSGDEKK